MKKINKSKMKYEMKCLRGEMKSAAEMEARDNKRYADVLAIDTETAKFGRGADRNQLRSIQLKIGRLVEERDNINTKLTAYYNASSEENPDTNYVEMFDKAERKARKKARKKLKNDKNEFYEHRYDIGDELFKHDKRSNQYIEICGQLARVEKQLNSGGKLTHKAKNRLLDERAKLRHEKKKLEKKLNKMDDKFKDRIARANAAREERIRTLVISLAVVGAIALIYFYRVEILEYVKVQSAAWLENVKVQVFERIKEWIGGIFG